MDAPNTRTVPLTLFSTECNFLENNFLTCLQEKSVKDDVPQMKCNVEQVYKFTSRFSGSTLSVLIDSVNTATLPNFETFSCNRKRARVSTDLPMSVCDSNLTTNSFVQMYTLQIKYSLHMYQEILSIHLI